MIETNKIYCGDCVKVMRGIDDNCIDLTVTSPPYDNLRKYEGYAFDFERLAHELYRVTKEGGVIVWIVGDATIDGGETGSSFRQVLHFKEIGFRIHDTMIYAKGGQGATGSSLGYWQDFEYMFVFTKGKIKTFNPIADRKNKTPSRNAIEYQGHRDKNDIPKGPRLIQRKKYGKRFNIWTYHEKATRTAHPAVFPEQLANDHIISWSNEGDLILDPMCGSGTTSKMARLTKRDYIGIDISEKYCEIARKRLQKIPVRLDMF